MINLAKLVFTNSQVINTGEKQFLIGPERRNSRTAFVGDSWTPLNGEVSGCYIISCLVVFLSDVKLSCCPATSATNPFSVTSR